MSAQQEREKKAQTLRTHIMFLGAVYVVVVVAISILLAGLVMNEINMYRVLGLSSLKIPLIKVSGNDVPRWSIQIFLAVLFFFLLQPFAVILLDLASRLRRQDDFDQPDETRQWR